MNRRSQQGITLVVSLIMLVVLTLLVVSAIRFSNINLRIAGNAQAEAEATAAAQVGLEKAVQLVSAATKPADVAAATYNVSTGGATYAVSVPKPSCIYSRNISNLELTDSPADRACFSEDPSQNVFDADGKPIPQPSSCKDQQWDVTASVTDSATGAKVTVLQGVSLRVSSEVSCP